MRESLIRAGFSEKEVNTYSSHSLRRGFVNFTDANGITMHQIMKRVGLKRPSTAIPYIDESDAIVDKLIKGIELSKMVDNVMLQNVTPYKSETD